MSFYDEISQFYDEMTRFEERLNREKNMLEPWVKRFGIKSALDIGCGTGVSTVALEKLEVKTNGLDPSARMVEKAKKNARQFNVNPKFEVSRMEDLVEDEYGNVDGVFILGNTIAHILSPEIMNHILTRLFTGLKRGALCVIQLLNYSRILTERERIVAVTGRGDHQYIRFHDFISPLVQFNILHVIKSDNAYNWSLHSTRQYPYTAQFFRELVQEFPDITFDLYSNMEFSGFDERTAKNLVCVFQKK